MSTPAAFFIGQGKDAVSLGSQHFDGYFQDEDNNSNGVPKTLLESTTVGQFKARYEKYLKANPAVKAYRQPILWENTRISHVYAFFGGHVWISCGGRWFNPYVKAKPPISVPEAPMARIGYIEGSVTITCGECCRMERVELKDILDFKPKVLPPTGISLGLMIDEYYLSKGFLNTPEQGWLCKECQPKPQKTKRKKVTQ